MKKILLAISLIFITTMAFSEMKHMKIDRVSNGRMFLIDFYYYNEYISGNKVVEFKNIAEQYLDQQGQYGEIYIKVYKVRNGFMYTMYSNTEHGIIISTKMPEIGGVQFGLQESEKNEAANIYKYWTKLNQTLFEANDPKYWDE